jgi:hypothetical protein
VMVKMKILEEVAMGMGMGMKRSFNDDAAEYSFIFYLIFLHHRYQEFETIHYLMK